MDVLIVFLVIIGIMMAVVLWQSHKETPRPALKVYLQRFSKLIVIILSIFKDIGVCIAMKIRDIDWDLTKVTKPAPSKAEPPKPGTGKLPELKSPPKTNSEPYHGYKGPAGYSGTGHASWR